MFEMAVESKKSTAAVLVQGVRAPSHTPTFTPDAWQVKLRDSGHIFERVDVLMSRFSELDCAALSEAQWENIARLDKLVFIMPLGTTPFDTALMLQRCINSIVASLPSALVLESITICNPPAASVMSDEGQDVTGLAAALKPLLNELDVQLDTRIASGALKHVVFAASSPCTTPLGANETIRVRAFFPKLAYKHIV